MTFERIASGVFLGVREYGGIRVFRSICIARWLGGVVLFSATPIGGLKWSSQEASRLAEVGAESVALVFSFYNAGSNPVRILSLRPSCDCLAATVTKNEWAPGERGEVRVVFTIGGRTGRQDKSVTVTTDDAPDKPVVLRLIVDIPEDVMIRPRTLSWEVGGKPVEKMAEVVVMEAEQAAEVGVQCSDERFRARAEATDKPGVFRVLVRPVETSVPAQTTVRLNVTLAGRLQVYVLSAAVK